MRFKQFIAAIPRLGVWLMIASACGEAPPTAPSHGTVQVTVRTEGGDLDTDGYMVVIGDITRNIAPGGTRTGPIIVPAGTHAASIAGVAQNCVVVDHPRSIKVDGDQTIDVTFIVDCAMTGIEIVALASGVNIPQAFTVQVGAEVPRPMPANAPLLVSRLPVGAHIVRLELPAHCQVASGAQRAEIPVTVVNRAMTRVTVDVACLAFVRQEKIAFVRTVREPNAWYRWIALANPDGTGVSLLRLGHAPAWSHDGSKLALSTTVCDEYYGYGCTGGLVIINPETGVSTTPDYGKHGFDPAWSPTGDAIAFSVCCEGLVGNTSSAIHIVGLNGNPSSVLPRLGVGSATQPSWSPDGQKIVFICSVSYDKSDICIIRRNGTDIVRLTTTDTYEAFPRWSPDGKTIVFGTYVAGAYKIATIPAAGGTITQLTDGSGPAWSPDGSRIVFFRNNGLFSMNSDGSNITRLTADSDVSPAWRPPAR